MPRSRIDILEDIASTVEHWLPRMGRYGTGRHDDRLFYCEHCQHCHEHHEEIEHPSWCLVNRLRSLLRVLGDTK